jgi:signal transduction histidine kinase/DNA-binding response OmpR family regulator
MTDRAPESVAQELAYYKRQVDAVAGQNLKLEYALSGLRHQVRQKQQGFALLSQLQHSIGAHKRISAIFETAIGAINSVLGMDRTVVLMPAGREHAYRPGQWAGFLGEHPGQFGSLEVDFPPEFAGGEGLLIVTSKTGRTPLADRIREAFGLPYFICVPVIADGAPIGLLLSGRLTEVPPLYPPLDQGDADTFRAIAGLISACVQNMRISVLEEMDRLKTEFFANISHEFRTPITLTLGPLEQVLAGRYGEVPGAVRGQLTVMRRNQQRLLELISQILDLAKLEAGRMELRCAPMPQVNQFIEQRAGQFGSAARLRGVELRLAFDERLDGADLYADQDKLDRLVVNLLSNAVKFTREGRIEVRTERAGDQFRLTVADTGAGIAPDELPYIFDRFRQAAGGAAREHAGTGIGLALVQEIAALHGGTVTAHSQPGKGSVFRVTIPLGSGHLNPASVLEFAAADEAGEPVFPTGFPTLGEAAPQHDVGEVNAAAEAAFDGTRRTILYAEDNADLRAHVRDLLAADYNVFVAADGRAALELLRARRCDLLVTDLMMPGAPGLDLVQAVRSDAALRAIPVLVLTARTAAGARIDSLDAGADDYIAKPFDAAEFRARVRSLLRVQDYQDTIRAQAGELAQWNRTLNDRVRQQVRQIDGLRAQLEAQLREVQASRSRIVQAADDARRRLERDLHDGAQQRLTTAGLMLRSAQARLGPGADPALARALEQAAGELRAGLGELRALARGLHPVILTDEGLVPALRALAGRSPVPVTVTAPPLGRLPGSAETAAYFIVSEALTNVTKHATAAAAQVTLEYADGTLIVTVTDDGAGGARLGAGSGLRGLADRVAALDGRLELDSPAGHGTRLRAELPCG